MAINFVVCHNASMKLESNGVIISLRPFGERDAIAHIFTEKFGVLSGMLRGAVVAKNKPMVGQMGAVAWGARLESQLGLFHFEAQKNLGLVAMVDANKLKYLNAMFALLVALLPEREAYQNLYAATIDALAELTPDSYLQWELVLLRELGYALDFSHCSNCGRTDNLIYLSPRTGRVVCGDCGAPYVGKLFDLPIDLNITLRFVESVCRGLDVSVPEYRIFLQHK